MVKLRLTRMGSHKRPFYRIVAADSRARRDGPFIEIIGTYNPLTEPSSICLKPDRVEYWLSKGAQPTETVKKLLKRTEAGQPGISSS